MEGVSLFTQMQNKHVIVERAGWGEEKAEWTVVIYGLINKHQLTTSSLTPNHAHLKQHS